MLTHYQLPDRVESEPDQLAETIRYYLQFTPNDGEWADVCKHPLANHCYAASEAYYHLSGRESELTPKQVWVKVETPEFEGKLSHWFLEDADGTVIDLTVEQFLTLDIDVPHDDAQGRGFVPPSPRMDTACMIEEMQNKPDYKVPDKAI